MRSSWSKVRGLLTALLDRDVKQLLGLLGGASFVNTFYLVSEEVADDMKEICMSSISIWHSLAILAAGFVGAMIL